MNEQLARNVVLMRAIETTDQAYEILSKDDRLYASRSARELAQWQASETGSEVTVDHFLQQRSEQILKRISERTPVFASFMKRRNGLQVLTAALPVLALISGAGVDRISDPHRVDLLSTPLLLIIGWNLLVYAGLLICLILPKAGWGLRSAGLLRRLSVGKAALPRSMPHTLAAALLAFMAEWAQLSSQLTRARLSRAIHLSAALFATGAMLSLYARGFLSQYAAGWESTFLDVAQVYAIVSVLFLPAVSIFQLHGFSIADIEALRFTQMPSALGGARWVHLYAATLFLLVVLPRLLLGAVANWRAQGLTRNFPIDLEQAYFRKLDDKPGSAAAVLRVLPYSFTLDEARDKGLAVIAIQLLGEQARVMLRPSFSYGEDAQQGLQGTRLDDANVTLTAALFNLAATPEKENHGAFLDYLLHESPRGVTVLIDESAYLARAGKERMAERIALWNEFCNFHKLSASIVNLLDPQARQAEVAAP